MRNLVRDRRGLAAVEFAVVTPMLMMLFLGFADAVQLGRGHLRVQSTATQLGQVISQCRKVSGGDQRQLMDLAQRLLGPFAGAGKDWAVVVTAIGRDAQNTAFTWTMQQRTSGITPASLGAQTPANLTLERNQMVFRTEVFVNVETTFFSKKTPLLATFTGSRPTLELAVGRALHMTRSGDVNELASQDTRNTGEECLA
jgi:Flp pilus assembly protein TadG